MYISRALVVVTTVLSQVGNAARIKIRAKNNNSTKQGDSVRLGIHAGRILNGRFRLDSLLETSPPLLGMGMPMMMPMGTPMMGGHMGGQMFGDPMWGAPLMGHGHAFRHQVTVQQTPEFPDEKPGESFPAGTEFSDQEPNHLGNGQFGDVWEATDMESGEKIAVKVFFQHTQTGKEYLTWNTADEANKEEMRKNIKECELVRDIITKGKAIYPQGARRICECKGEYINQGMTNKDNVMYTVWEMCGKSMTKIRDELGELGPVERQKAARLMTKQVMEAINLFSMFKPGLIHHDLKADNAVVLGSLEEGYEVKLIDFGCFVRADPGNKYSQSIGDPNYMPPEHSVSSKAFSDPPSSFDMYGIGLIHMEMLCPAIEQKDWSPAQRMTQQMMMMGQKPVLSGHLIEGVLKSKCPDLFGRRMAAAGRDVNVDLDLIRNLIKQRPTDRLLPAAGLEHKAMVAEINTKVRLEFSVGDNVEYYSVTHDRWFPCVVIKVDTTHGWYDLGHIAKGNPLMKPQADPSKVKAQQLEDLSVDESLQVPLVAMVFKVNEQVEYHQESAGRWVDCLVAKVTQNEDGSGFYDLNLLDGTPFRLRVTPERVREPPFAPGTSVIVYGSLTGTVVEYDSVKESYNILKSGTKSTFFQNVGRDNVERPRG